MWAIVRRTAMAMVCVIAKAIVIAIQDLLHLYVTILAQEGVKTVDLPQIPMVGLECKGNTQQ